MHVTPRARDEGKGSFVGAGASAGHKPATTRAAWTSAQLARVLPLLPSDSELRCACTPCDTRRRLGAWCWKPRLARRRTGVNRRGEASRWCGSVQQFISRPQPARHGPRAAGSSAAPRSSDSKRRHTCAARETRHKLVAGGRSWYVAPRAHAERKRPLNGTVRFGAERDDNNQRSMARTFSKLECCASSLVTASAGVLAPHGTGRWFGVAGCSWLVTPRARIVRERPLAGSVHFRRLRTVYDQRRMACALSKLQSCASSPVTAIARVPAPRENGCASLELKTAACTSNHERVTKESGLSLAQGASVGHKPTTTRAERHGRAASSSAAPPP